MKRKDLKQLHDTDKKELLSTLMEKTDELNKTRVEMAAGKVRDTQILNKIRHDIARIKTVLVEKERA